MPLLVLGILSRLRFGSPAAAEPYVSLYNRAASSLMEAADAAGVYGLRCTTIMAPQVRRDRRENFLLPARCARWGSFVPGLFSWGPAQPLPAAASACTVLTSACWLAGWGVQEVLEYFECAARMGAPVKVYKGAGFGHTLAHHLRQSRFEPQVSSELCLTVPCQRYHTCIVRERCTAAAPAGPLPLSEVPPNSPINVPTALLRAAAAPGAAAGGLGGAAGGRRGLQPRHPQLPQADPVPAGGPVPADA